MMGGGVLLGVKGDESGRESGGGGRLVVVLLPTSC